MIEVGSYWVCNPNETKITIDSVFCKVLFIGERDVYIMRNTHYGFTSLSPKAMKIRDFLNIYRKTEEYGYTGRS